MAVSMIFQTLYYLVDLYFVSQLGKESIAGVSMAGNLMFAVLALTQMLAVGTTSLIAQAAGRKDQQTAQAVFHQSCILSILAGVAVLVLGAVFRLPYCRALSADSQTVREGAAYLFWFIPALGLQFGFVSMGAALRGTGIAKPTMIVSVITVILNILLAPILIAGWGTGRPMGAAGAGLASLIAMAAGVIVMTLMFQKLETFVGFDRELWSPRIDIWKRTLAIGLPAGGEFAVMSLFAALVYYLIRGFGASAQAGFGIGARVMQSIFLPVMAVAFAASPVAGQNYGARKSSRVRETFRTASLLGAVLMIAVTLLIHISPQLPITFFTTDQQVVVYGAEYLEIVSWGFIAFGLTFTASGIFQALGNTVPPLASSVCRLAIFATVAAYLSNQPGFSSRQLWILTLATGVVQTSLCVWLLRREFARKLTF